MNTEYINKILEIGKKGSCSSEELDYFLTKLPDVGNRELRDILRRDYKVSTEHITRREFLAINPKIIKQAPSETQNKISSFLIDFIKGCHLIEVKYGGFGSTTNIYNLFSFLIEIDANKAIDLYNWIASTGGNYYIDSGVTFEESKKREQIAEKNRIEILANDQRVHSDAVARKQHNRDLHSKSSDETQRLYKKYKEELQKMNDDQLIVVFNKDVGNTDRVGARARFHSAIYEVFKSRGFDFSAIGNNKRLFFANKIALIGKKIVKNSNS